MAGLSGIGIFLGLSTPTTSTPQPLLPKGFVVKSVKDGGPAALDGRMTQGDMLIEIDGKRLAGLNLEQATSLVLGNPNSR